MNEIRIKRVYEPAEPADGFRVLVDRVWPRGLTKEKVAAETWLKEAAPSTQLRKEFHHDRAKWDQFKVRYFAELDQQPEAVAFLLEEAARAPLTLLFSASDTEYNNAAALREYLIKRGS